MAVSTTHSAETPPTPRTTAVRRLAVEAAKFEDVPSGNALPLSEVRKQAAANGYTEREIHDLLEADGLTGATEIRVPPQGDLLGDLWATDDTGPTAESPPTDETDSWDDRPPTYGDGCSAEPLDTSVEDCYALREPIAHSADVVDKGRYLDEDGAPLTAFEAVGSYIEQRHGEGTTAERHGWVKGRQYYAKQQYRRGMAMDRQLLDRFDNPTTALLSLRLSPTTGSRLTLLSALGDAVGPTIDQLRYRLQRAPDAPLAATEWVYFAVIAGTEKRATPHLHVLVYCADDVSRERFVPVVETFVEKCDYAPDDCRGNAPDGGAISLRGNDSDSVPRVDDDALDPTDCEYRGRNSRGAVYALTQLPHLRDVDDMARDELLHGSTVDAWGGDAFRRSRVKIEEEYLATGPV